VNLWAAFPLYVKLNVLNIDAELINNGKIGGWGYLLFTQN
jgi:hypothetical protein